MKGKSNMSFDRNTDYVKTKIITSLKEVKQSLNL